MEDLKDYINLGTNVVIVLIFLRYLAARDIQLGRLIRKGNKTASLLAVTVAELNATILTYFESLRNDTPPNEKD